MNSPRHTLFLPVAWVMVAAIVLFGAVSPADARSKEPRGIELLESIQSVFVEVAETVRPGVVSIRPVASHMSGQRPDMEERPPHGPAPDSPHGSPHLPFMPDDDEPGEGSGIVLDQNGHIVTNAHVLGNATQMEVRLHDGRHYTADLVGRDTETDLAVLRLARPDGDKPLPVVKLGDSDAVRPGQWSIAIGNPFGLEHTVTVGIVSGVGREGVNLTRYENFIQTDASINPGNSGGPLFNIHGEVIGLNTAIMTFAQGIGFAIPVNMMREITTHLIASGHVERGWLGVGIQEVGPELAETFGVQEGKGVLVNEVFPGQPAQVNGIIPGDIILTLNGREIGTPKTLARLIASITPDEIARLTVLRDGKPVSIDVTLGRRDPVTQVAILPEPAPPAPQPSGVLGLDLQPLTLELAEQLGIGGEGLVVTQMNPDGPAALKGVREGDVIREINRTPVAQVEEFNEVLASRAPEDKILLRISRESGGWYVVIEP